MLIPIVGLGAFLWWAGRDIVQSSVRLLSPSTFHFVTLSGCLPPVATFIFLVLLYGMSSDIIHQYLLIRGQLLAILVCGCIFSFSHLLSGGSIIVIQICWYKNFLCPEQLEHVYDRS